MSGKLRFTEKDFFKFISHVSLIYFALFVISNVYLYKLLKLLCRCFPSDLFDDTSNKKADYFQIFKNVSFLETAIYYTRLYGRIVARAPRKSVCRRFTKAFADTELLSTLHLEI